MPCANRPLDRRQVFLCILRKRNTPVSSTKTPAVRNRACRCRPSVTRAGLLIPCKSTLPDNNFT